MSQSVSQLIFRDFWNIRVQFFLFRRIYLLYLKNDLHFIQYTSRTVNFLNLLPYKKNIYRTGIFPISFPNLGM